MSKIIEDLRAKLASIGGKLDDTEYDLYLDAPPGYMWCAKGGPCFLIPYATNSESWLAKAVREEQVNLRMGLMLVTDARRLDEIQWDLGDDDWVAPAGAPARLEWPTT